MTWNHPLKIIAFALLSGVFLTPPADANFHLWEIKEIYTNSDGTVQFIELFTSSDGQHVLNNHQIIASLGGDTHTFTFPSSSGTPTEDKHLLIATAGFSLLTGSVAPDFTLPDGFLFAPNGTVNFVGADSRTYTTLPTDGVMSLNYPGGTLGVNSPTNFAGTQGNVDASTGATPTETATASQTETPSPTETPSATPTSEDLTESPTIVNSRSADLDGNPGVDARDLILFLEIWRQMAFGAPK